MRAPWKRKPKPLTLSEIPDGHYVGPTLGLVCQVWDERYEMQLERLLRLEQRVGALEVTAPVERQAQR